MLAGCAPSTPALSSEISEQLQNDVVALANAAAAGDTAGAQSALAVLETRLAEGLAANTITADRGESIQAAVELVRADLVALTTPDVEPTTPTETTTPVETTPTVEAPTAEPTPEAPAEPTAPADGNQPGNGNNPGNGNTTGPGNGNGPGSNNGNGNGNGNGNSDEPDENEPDENEPDENE